MVRWFINFEVIITFNVLIKSVVIKLGIINSIADKSHVSSDNLSPCQDFYIIHPLLYHITASHTLRTPTLHSTLYCIPSPDLKTESSGLNKSHSYSHSRSNSHDNERRKQRPYHSRTSISTIGVNRTLFV